MTKRIKINGRVYQRKELIFLDDRVEWEDYLKRTRDRDPAHEDLGRSLNEREDGTLMPWEDVPDGLSRTEEDARMDPKFLTLTNEIEVAGREIGVLAATLRLAGAQGAKNAGDFARAAAQNVRALADRILNAGGAASGITMEPLFTEENPGGGIPVIDL